MNALARRLGPAVIGIVSLSACASVNGGEVVSGPTVNSHVQVEVTNHNWADMRVYVESRAGMQRRVGMVTSMKTMVLRIPSSVVSAGPIRLIADPIGAGSRYVSPQIHVGAGEWVELTIQNNLPISTVSVWAGRSR